MPLQKSAGSRSGPRYCQTTKWCVPGVALTWNPEMSIGLRLGATRYSHPSRSPPDGIMNGVMRIWKPRAGLRRGRRPAPAAGATHRQTIARAMPDPMTVVFGVVFIPSPRREEPMARPSWTRISASTRQPGFRAYHPSARRVYSRLYFFHTNRRARHALHRVHTEEGEPISRLTEKRRTCKPQRCTVRRVRSKRDLPV